MQQTIRSESAPTLRGRADSSSAAGGVSRPLDVPGAELTVTPADAFSLTAVPKSMIVIGAGATGAQVASIFNAFGSSVTICQAGPRIVASEDAEVSDAVARGVPRRRHGDLSRLRQRSSESSPRRAA